ncbi:MAG: ATP-binding protein [Conexivisphaera sp.]
MYALRRIHNPGSMRYQPGRGRAGELLRGGVPREDTLRKPRARAAQGGWDLLKGYCRVFGPEDSPGPIYLILDEVQLVRDWGRWVRRVSDSSKHRIYVTGSTSETTSREMVDAPRGRNVNHTLFPFSFREFLRTPGIATPDLRVFPYLEERGPS